MKDNFSPPYKRWLWLVLAVALAARAAAWAFQVLYGFYYIAWLRGLTPWQDFYAYYSDWLRSLSRGLLPYRDFAYPYPPLFLFTLNVLYATEGPQAASLPIVLADAMTAPLIYKLVSLDADRKVAIMAGLAYAVLPTAVFYEGYVWMSTQPMLLFIMLSVYYARKRHTLRSGLMLALASLYKQQALFILPAYLLWLGLRSWRHAAKAMAILLLTLIAASAPFLVSYPGQYMSAMSYGLLPQGYHWNATSSTQGSESATEARCFVSTSPLPGDTSCNYAFITYPNPRLTLLIQLLDFLAHIVPAPLLASSLLLPIARRRDEGSLGLWCSYSLALLLQAFHHMTGHPLYAYYYVPLYAMLLAGARTVKGLALAAAFATMAALLPDGNPQALIASLALVALAFAWGPRRAAQLDRPSR